MSLPIIQRSCGGCFACCEVLSIDDEPADFHKPVATLCTHIADGKCSIYSTKPGVCTGYYCMWMVNHYPGMFKPGDRPDLSGILLTMNNPDSDWVKYSGIPSFTAYETKPGAFLSYWGNKLLKKVSHRWLVILMPWSARESQYKVNNLTKFIGPAKHINLVMKFNAFKDRLDGKNS